MQRGSKTCPMTNRHLSPFERATPVSISEGIISERSYTRHPNCSDLDLLWFNTKSPFAWSALLLIIKKKVPFSKFASFEVSSLHFSVQWFDIWPINVCLALPLLLSTSLPPPPFSPLLVSHGDWCQLDEVFLVWSYSRTGTGEFCRISIHTCTIHSTNWIPCLLQFILVAFKF